MGYDAWFCVGCKAYPLYYYIDENTHTIKRNKQGTGNATKNYSCQKECHKKECRKSKPNPGRGQVLFQVVARGIHTSSNPASEWPNSIQEATVKRMGPKRK